MGKHLKQLMWKVTYCCFNTKITNIQSVHNGSKQNESKASISSILVLLSFPDSLSVWLCCLEGTIFFVGRYELLWYDMTLYRWWMVSCRCSNSACFSEGIFGGYNVPLFCGITGVFENYYGMASALKSRNYNTLTYHNDSWDTARKSQQDHASNLGADYLRFINENQSLFL